MIGVLGNLLRDRVLHLYCLSLGLEGVVLGSVAARKLRASLLLALVAFAAAVVTTLLVDAAAAALGSHSSWHRYFTSFVWRD